MPDRTHFVVRNAPVGGAAEHIHTRFQRMHTMGGMTTGAGPAGQPFAHGPIHVFDPGGVAHASAS
jgi:hypothetical protein